MLASQLLLLRAATTPCVLASCVETLAGARTISTTANAQRQAISLQAVKDILEAPIRKTQHVKEMITAAPKELYDKIYDKLPPNMQHILGLMKKPSLLQRTVTINCQAAWENHGLKIALGGGIILTLSLWRAIHLTCGQFPSLATHLSPWYIMEPTIAALLASTISLTLVTTIRRRYSIQPTQAYKEALKRLNNHKGVREIMGGPVAGSKLRACVVGGGRLTFHNWVVPSYVPPHLHLVFPLSGADRRGLVSLQAKKSSKGELQVPLLVLDVPLPAAVGGEQRIYLEGGPGRHASDSVLEELRRPFMAAMTNEEILGDKLGDDGVMDPWEAQKAKAAVLLEQGAEKMKKERQGMFLYEEVYFKAKDWWNNARRRISS